MRLRTFQWLCLVFGLALATFVATARAEVQPYRSWSKLSWSNGYAPGYYDLDQRRVVSLREHLYAAYDENTRTRDLLYDLYFGLAVGDDYRWLTDVSVDEAGYAGDTGVVRVVQTFGAVRATQYFYGPFTSDGPAMVAAIEVTNLGTATLESASVFSLQNFHVGGGDGINDESIRWIDGAYEERGPDQRLILHRPVPADAVHSASPENPWQRVNSGQGLVNVDDSGVRDDAVAGFQWDISGLAPGQTKTFAVVLGYSAGGDREQVDGVVSSSIAPSAAETLTLAFDDWQQYQAQALVPQGLSEAERAVYHRALAVLRMAQVREAKPSRGQIVASMPPGKWNIAWVRDQSYAINGLLAAGMTGAARDALAFILEGEAGGYVCCDKTGQPYVGRDYAISVTRYYGSGKEESDWNHNGPNVEFDGFGMTLRDLERYITVSGDVAFVEEHAAAIFEGTADVLLSLIEAETGLVRADSSIWETHWDNGGRRHHTYTQVAAAAGLRSAAVLAEAVGRAEDAARYRQAGDSIAEAVGEHLVDINSSVLRSSLEEYDSYLDGSVVEAFNWDVLPSEGSIVRATLDAFKEGLWNTVVGRGYRRSDDGDAYDLREWVIVDLRIAAAARRAGRGEHADELLDWITGQARMNFDIIPENFNQLTGAFEGEVPMAGFGAGVYISALWERAAGIDEPDDKPEDEGEDPENPALDPQETTASGCGCDSTGDSAPAGAFLFALVVLVTLRRRRGASSTASTD
jgi:MYXO-CTERM domain-containing protein